MDRYVAFEIDKYAICIAKKNHPEIEECGDVIGADFTRFRGFDFVIGGSPCQGFSFAGKQLNFNDPRSALFFAKVQEELEWLQRSLADAYFEMYDPEGNTERVNAALQASGW